MSRLRARLGVFVWAVAPVPWLLAHCGSDNGTRAGTDAGDAAAQDAFSNDRTLPDVSSEEAAMASDGGASDGDAAGDASGDAASDATGDSGEGSADASDAGADAADSSDGSDGEAGTVLIPCVDAGDGGPSCSGSLMCCGIWCVDTTRDPQNCGSCGNACSATQFCTGVACDDAILKNVCDNPKATVVFDIYPPDNDAGVGLATALSTGCTPGVTFVTSDEDGGTAQDPATGRPLTGPGNTFIAGGGAFGQGGVAYMDGHALTTVTLGTDGTNAWYRNRKTGTNVVIFPVSMLTAQHDYFLLELSVEPVSGSLCLFEIGANAPGTTAGAYYFQTNVMPQRATFTDAWYLYEWTDTDSNLVPSAGDTFTLLAQGM